MESESIIFVSPRASNPEEAIQELVDVLDPYHSHGKKLSQLESEVEGEPYQEKRRFFSKKHSIWPWLLLFALLGGLVWLLVRAAQRTCLPKVMLGKKGGKKEVTNVNTTNNPGKTIAFPGDTIDKFNSEEISTLQSLKLSDLLGYFRRAPALSMEQKEILAPSMISEWKLVDRDTEGANRQWIYNFPESNQRSQDHSWKIFYDRSNGWVLKDPVYSSYAYNAYCNPSLPWYPECLNANGNNNYNNGYYYSNNNNYNHYNHYNHKNYDDYWRGDKWGGKRSWSNSHDNDHWSHDKWNNHDSNSSHHSSSSYRRSSH